MRFKDKNVRGKLLPLLLVLVIGGLTLSGCYGRSQPKGWSGAAVDDDTILVGALAGKLIALDKADGSYQWLDEQAGAPGTEAQVAIYTTPAVAGDLGYIGGYNGKIYAFVLATGSLRWVYPREGNLNPVIGNIAVSRDQLYFGDSAGKFYALDAATGDRLWSTQLGDKIWASPTLNGDTIYVGSFDENLYALNTADGNVRWKTDELGTVITTPLVVGDTVYVGSFNRYFYAVNATSGTMKWRSENEAGKWFWAKSVADEGVIYAPNLDGKVYLFDAESGLEVAPPADLGDPISADPVLADNRVVLATETGSVYAMASANEAPTLLVKLGDNGDQVLSPLSADGNIVYVKTQTSNKDTLHAVNIDTGETVWSQALFGTEEEAPTEEEATTEEE